MATITGPARCSQAITCRDTHVDSSAGDRWPPAEPCCHELGLSDRWPRRPVHPTVFRRHQRAQRPMRTVWLGDRLLPLSIYGTEYNSSARFEPGNGLRRWPGHFRVRRASSRGRRWEMQLKGGGPTPYCCGADGRRRCLPPACASFLASGSSCTPLRVSHLTLADAGDVARRNRCAGPWYSAIPGRSIPTSWWATRRRSGTRVGPVVSAGGPTGAVRPSRRSEAHSGCVERNCR